MSTRGSAETRNYFWYFFNWIERRNHDGYVEVRRVKWYLDGLQQSNSGLKKNKMRKGILLNKTNLR